MSIDVSYQIASLESRSDGKSFLSKFKAFFHLVSRDYFKKLSPEVSFLSTKPSNVSKIDYMTIRKRSVTRPRKLKSGVSMMDYVTVLQRHAEKQKEIRKRVLFKWKASIAGFLTNPRELITGASTGHIEWIDPKEIKTELGKVYDEDVSQVGDAFGNLYRNMNEFSMAQKIINNAVELVQTESPIAVEKEVAEINDLLNQLLDTISENDDVTMSKSTEAFLVEGLNLVIQEVELYALLVTLIESAQKAVYATADEIK